MASELGVYRNDTATAPGADSLARPGRPQQLAAARARHRAARQDKRMAAVLKADMARMKRAVQHLLAEMGHKP